LTFPPLFGQQWFWIFHYSNIPSFHYMGFEDL